MALVLGTSACTSSPTTSAPLASTQVEHEHYLVEASRGPCDATTCAVSATVTPKGHYHVNAEYPHRFVAEGVAVTDVSADVDPAKLVVTAKAPSSASLRLFMSVCSDEKCLIEKVPLPL